MLQAKECVPFSVCACHPCAGAMLNFSVSFRIDRVVLNRNPKMIQLSPWQARVRNVARTLAPVCLVVCKIGLG